MKNAACAEELPDILTVSEAARYLRLSKAATYEAVRQKLIPAVRLGRRIVIPKASLTAMLERETRGGGAAERNR